MYKYVELYVKLIIINVKLIDEYVILWFYYVKILMEDVTMEETLQLLEELDEIIASLGSVDEELDLDLEEEDKDDSEE